MRRAVLLPPCAIVALSILACAIESSDSGLAPFAAGEAGFEGDDAGEAAAESSDEGTTDGSQAGTGSDDDSSDHDSSDHDDDPPIKFDIPVPEPLDEDKQPCGVDILFVIDNSGSMSQHKQKFVDAFASFIDEMTTALQPGTLVHVGVTRATGFFNPGNGSGWSDPSCKFGFLDGVWYPPTQANNGVNGQQGRLYEKWGMRYFEYEVGQDTIALGEWFEGTLMGAIALDQASNSESVVAAAAYPFHPINAEYNAGFSREKAVLVLFLLSDAPDATPAEIPTSEFIDMVSAAKAGCGDACVLPTGVVQLACYDKPGNVNTRVFDFMNGFGAPPAALDYFWMNMGPESFASALGATLAESIAYTCEYIVPAD